MFPATIGDGSLTCLRHLVFYQHMIRAVRVDIIQAQPPIEDGSDQIQTIDSVLGSLRATTFEPLSSLLTGVGHYARFEMKMSIIVHRNLENQRVDPFYVPDPPPAH